VSCVFRSWRFLTHHDKKEKIAKPFLAKGRAATRSMIRHADSKKKKCLSMQKSELNMVVLTFRVINNNLILVVIIQKNKN
jgi:hypothetical protein